MSLRRLQFDYKKVTVKLESLLDDVSTYCVLFILVTPHIQLSPFGESTLLGQALGIRKDS